MNKRLRIFKIFGLYFESQWTKLKVHNVFLQGKKLKPEQEADEEEDEAGDVTDEDEAADIEQNAQAPSMDAEGGDGDSSR